MVAGAQATTILFSFDNAPIHTSLPIDLSEGGVSAHFSATGQNFSIQRADALGWKPLEFEGLCIYPNSVFAADLLIGLSQPVYGFSIMYAPEEYGCDSSARMRVTAYQDAAYVGTNTTTASPPGTWPTGTLTFSSTVPFNRLVVHYDAAPPTGGDWGPIFLADNMTLTLEPVVPISGRIVLQDLDGSHPGLQVPVEIRPVSGDPEVVTATLDGTGHYTVNTTVQGLCDISAKGSHWLRKTVHNMTMGPSGLSNVNLTLKNGDIDGDNEIAIGDYAVLSYAFNARSGDWNWEPEADLNLDDAVDIGDFSILSQNFNLLGDD
jgi:hypothetical protein